MEILYFELWVDKSRREEIKAKLMKIFDEVYDVFYDYDFIVRADDEEKLREIDGIKFREHYKC